MQTVQQFITKVGRKRFMDRVGVKTQVVTRAIAENTMPTAWFISVRALCTEDGVETPEDLFRWSGKSVTPFNAPSLEAL